MTTFPDDMSKNHLRVVGVCMARIVQQVDLVLELATAAKDKHDPGLENEISEALGKIHTLAENAMNDYRVNRKVSNVDAKWREYMALVARQAKP